MKSNIKVAYTLAEGHQNTDNTTKLLKNMTLQRKSVMVKQDHYRFVSL